MQSKIANSIFVISLAVLAACTLPKSSVPSTRDAEIDALINQMTLEEKAGQMTQINLDVVCEGGIYNLVEPHHIDEAKLRNALLKYHVGSVLNCGGHAYPREQWLNIIGKIQQVASTETRMKIPVIYGIDAIHGANYVMGSTLFPQPIAQAATFNKEAVKEAGRITAYETRAAGMDWNFSPVLDVARQPLWSRVFETYGEDQLVCATLGSAAIEGYQGNNTGNDIDKQHVAACMKHFLGYSGSRTGKDRTPAYIPEIMLREIYLPPFKRAVETGALTVMINSGEVNGIPVHANKAILTDLLRNELRFEGLAVTDWEDVMKLRDNHKVASDLKEATYMAVEAGIDMCMVPNDFSFTEHLISLVKEGRIKESRLNESVYRILWVKKKLGILKNPLVPSVQDFPDFASEKHQQHAREVALESITLLNNSSYTLPLKRDLNLFVTGPASNSMTMLNGAWTRTWQGVDPKWDDTTKFTIAEALKKYTSGNVVQSDGVTAEKPFFSDLDLKKTSEADVVVLCVGDGPSTEIPGNISSLELPDYQMNYAKTLLALNKPVILVLVSNRPLIVRDIADKCAAVIQAYQPGDYGGEALAKVIFGLHNPTGRLPYTYPRYSGELIWYDHKNTETFDTNFGHKGFNPQWEFGHGLSYGKVGCTNVKLSKNKIAKGENISASCEITNESDLPVNYTVLLFARDEVASITPSVKKLIAFEKVNVPAHSKVNTSIPVLFEKLGFVGADMQHTVEPGMFTIMLENQEMPLEYAP